MDINRRISVTYKDLPGGQVLGPTFDYTNRLLDFSLEESDEPSQTPLESPEGIARTMPRVTDLLADEQLMAKESRTTNDVAGDLTREPLAFPANRSVRLQALARGDEGFLLSIGYASIRGHGGYAHPFVGELRFGEVGVEFTPPELGFPVPVGRIQLTECQTVNQFKGSAETLPQFTRGYGLSFGQSERKAIAMSLVDWSLRAREFGDDVTSPTQDEEFVLSHADNMQATGFVEHLKLPHYIEFQSELELLRQIRAGRGASMPHTSETMQQEAAQ